MNKIIKVAIRNLVEFIMRYGSIDNRYTSSIKAIEGIRGHQKVQKSYGNNYTAEVPLKYTLTYEDLEIHVEGRADGILIEDGKTIIDGIKTTTKDLLLIDENTNPLHWAQAKCYGYIYEIIKKSNTRKMSFKERLIETFGVNPFKCSNCGSNMILWEVWHYKYGIVLNRLFRNRR